MLRYFVYGLLFACVGALLGGILITEYFKIELVTSGVIGAVSGSILGILVATLFNNRVSLNKEFATDQQINALFSPVGFNLIFSFLPSFIEEPFLNWLERKMRGSTK